MNAVTPERNHIFISYSHLDGGWLERLTKHLQPLLGPAALDVWSDKRIVPGADWRAEIEAAIARARIAVLLVSGDFLASRFISEVELPQILARQERDHLLIFWIPLSASNYHATAIARFQAAHDPAQPLNKLRRAKAEEALVQICNRLIGALETGPTSPRLRPETRYLQATIDYYEGLRRNDARNVQRNILDFFVEALGATVPPTPSVPSSTEPPPELKSIWELLLPQLAEHNPCLILADFGLGKSWLQQTIHYRQAHAILDNQAPVGRQWTPFYVNLQTYRRPSSKFSLASLLAFRSVNNPPSIIAHIRDKAWAGAYGESYLQARRAELVAQFEEGRQMFLLDGLDEMRKEDARSLLSELGELARAVHRSPVLLTCRRTYFRDQAEEKRLADNGFQVFYLWPWSLEQLLNYLEKAHRHKVLSAPADAVLSRLNSAYGLRDVASRALLAAMLVDQWDEIGAATKIDVPALYDRHIEKALLHWQAPRAWKLSMEQLRVCMEELAFLMFQLDVRAISRQELDKYFAAKFRELGISRFSEVADLITQDIQNNSFLLRHDADYVFCHASFGDFLVARKLFRALCDQDDAPLSLTYRSKQYQPIFDTFLIPMLRAASKESLLAQLYRV